MSQLPDDLKTPEARAVIKRLMDHARAAEQRWLELGRRIEQQSRSEGLLTECLQRLNSNTEERSDRVCDPSAPPYDAEG